MTDTTIFLVENFQEYEAFLSFKGKKAIEFPFEENICLECKKTERDPCQDCWAYYTLMKKISKTSGNKKITCDTIPGNGGAYLLKRGTRQNPFFEYVDENGNKKEILLVAVL